MTLEVFSLSWWSYIAAGAGIFLFGMSFLGDGLKKVAGRRIKGLLDKYASSPIKGAAIGALVTIVIHSAGTTTLTIGLIKSGLMTLTQAAGIIMGANIGTTITSFIIGLNISSITPFILLIGALIYFLTDNRKMRSLAIVLIGFGAIFFGMTLMEFALKPLASMPKFIELIKNLSGKPLVGVLVGALSTIVIQSSAGFIGIVQSLYSSAIDSGFTLNVALPLIFGSNIGTTFTAIIASLGGSKEGKKAALIHVLFNVIGSIIFLILLNPYCDFILWLSELLHLIPKMQIAVSHIIFNLVTTAILLPCAPLLVKIVNWIVGNDQVNPVLEQVNLSALDRNVLELIPDTALSIAKDQAIVMGNLAAQAIQGCYDYFNTKDKKAKELTLEIEQTLDTFDQKLNAFLSSMEHSTLEPHNMELYGRILKTYKDIERIGDHCENIVQYFEEIFDRKEEVDNDIRSDINSMLELSKEMMLDSIESFAHRNTFAANIVTEKENKLDELNRLARERHVKRIVSGEENAQTYLSLIFVDLTGNIERIGDHCQNIADSILKLK